MISRRTFGLLLVKAFSLGYFLPVIEFLESCTYRKKDTPVPKKVLAKNIVLIYPKGGEHFETSTIGVGWKVENIDTLNILISYDSGESWKYLKKGIHALALKEDVTIPTSPIFADNCLLKIEDAVDKKKFDQCPATFSIHIGSLEDSIQLLNPIDGGILLAQQSFEIKWESVNCTNFVIQLLIDDLVRTTIASNVQGSTYTWQVADVKSSNAKIRIRNADNETVYDVNEIPFRIEKEYYVDLGVHTELLVTGGYKIFDDAVLGTFVIKKISPTEYKTFSMSCTHNGCLIAIKSDQSFSCSCHGSAFDASGNVTQGPAELPLFQWRTEYFISENKLTVYSY